MKCSNTSHSAFEELYTDGYFNSQLEKFKNRKTNHWAPRINKVFSDIETHNISAKKVLDLGTSVGTYAYEFADRGYESYGIDLSEEAIRIAKHIASKDDKEITYIVGDISKKEQFCPNKFDLIYAGDIIEHLEQELLKKTLENCHNWLAEGGSFIFHTVPTKYDIVFHKSFLWVLLVPFAIFPDKIFSNFVKLLYTSFNALLKIFTGKSWQDRERETVHCNLQTASELSELLKEAGFDIVELQTIIVEERFKNNLKMQIFGNKVFFQKDIFGICKK